MKTRRIRTFRPPGRKPGKGGKAGKKIHRRLLMRERPRLTQKPTDGRGLSQRLAKDHLVVPGRVEVAQAGLLLVGVLEVEAPGRLVVGQAGRLDEEHAGPVGA